MITYARESYDRIYSARLFSVSTLVCLAIYFLILVLPFVLVYASNNFWITIIKNMEQPRYTLLNDYYVSVLRNDRTQIFSNIQAFEQADFGTQLQDGRIDSRVYDHNSDDIADEIQFDISFGNDANTVTQLVIILPLDVELESAAYKARSLLMFNLAAPSGMSSVQIFGTIGFFQTSALSQNNFLQYEYNYDIFAKNNYDMVDLFSDYYTRQFLIKPIYSTQVVAGNDQLRTNIGINLIVDQKQPLLIKPTLFGTLKFSWLQYCSVFIPIYFLGRTLLQFLYRFRFTHTHRSSNLPIEFKEF